MSVKIDVKDVTKTFKLGKKQQKLNQTKEKVKTAVNNLSFQVNEGEIYGLLGSNGAGKTTMLRMISTLIKPDQGDVMVDGYSVTKQSFDVRKRIAFLTSELKLEDFFTPSYMYDFYSDLHGVEVDVRIKRKETLFSLFEITPFSEVKIGDLSTGMKQKVSLAVSLVHDPDIIIFDEPTNGLDVLTAKVVVDFLVSLKEKKKTIIVSTHIFSLIEKVCDRVGIIVDGKMVKETHLKDILSLGTLEDYFFESYQHYYEDKKI